MKQAHGYCLKEIAGVFYLLPYGQLISDHCRGVQLNEAGIHWKKYIPAVNFSNVLSDIMRLKKMRFRIWKLIWIHF